MSITMIQLIKKWSLVCIMLGYFNVSVMVVFQLRMHFKTIQQCITCETSKFWLEVESINIATELSWSVITLIAGVLWLVESISFQTGNLITTMERWNISGRWSPWLKIHYFEDSQTENLFSCSIRSNDVVIYLKKDALSCLHVRVVELNLPDFRNQTVNSSDDVAMDNIEAHVFMYVQQLQNDMKQSSWSQTKFYLVMRINTSNTQIYLLQADKNGSIINLKEWRCIFVIMESLTFPSIKA